MPENEVKVEISKEELDKLKALPDVVQNLVNELKDERTLKQTAEAKATALEAKLNAPVVVPPVIEAPIAEDPTKVFERLMAQKEQEVADVARQTAEAKFKDAHKEFHPENDPGGLKYAAFEKTLARLNTTGLKTEAEFLSVHNDALRLMTQPAPQETTFAPYADTPSNGGGSPHQTDVNGLSPQEKKLIASVGWTEERYLKLKKQRPDYVKQVLEFAK
jgi:hypothetical protein